MNITLRMSVNGWKGTCIMWSTCIKFKERSGWRPMCRQAETLEGILAIVNDAFDNWDVKHASIFSNGNFITCYWTAPHKLKAARMTARATLTRINHVW